MKQVFVCTAIAVFCLFLATERVVAQDGADQTELFKRLDKNSDGKLTKAEIGAERARFFERLVRIGDKDDDGQLTTGEFTAALSRDPGTDPAPVNGRPQGRPQFSPQQVFAGLDRNRDGKVTVEEVPERVRPFVKGLLRRAGKKEDESLTREEFTKLMSRRPAAGNQQRAAGLFRQFDTNRDGKVTLAETPQRAKPVVKGMLQRAGKKEDGVLTQAEFTKHLPRFGGQPVRPGGNAFVKGLIMRLDRDGDGKLSKAEAPGQMKENFSRRDRNNDGTLDESELANIFRSAPGKTRPKSKRPKSKRPPATKKK